MFETIRLSRTSEKMYKNNIEKYLKKILYGFVVKGTRHPSRRFSPFNTGDWVTKEREQVGREQIGLARGRRKQLTKKKSIKKESHFCCVTKTNYLTRNHMEYFVSQHYTVRLAAAICSLNPTRTDEQNWWIRSWTTLDWYGPVLQQLEKCDANHAIKVTCNDGGCGRNG